MAGAPAGVPGSPSVDVLTKLYRNESLTPDEKKEAGERLSNIYNVCIREELPKPESEKANAWQKELGDKKVVQLSGGTTRQIPEEGLQFIRYVKTGKPDAAQPQGSSSASRLHNFVYIEKASKWWTFLRPIATAIKKARIMRKPENKDKIAIVGEGPKIDLKKLTIMGEGAAPSTSPFGSVELPAPPASSYNPGDIEDQKKSILRYSVDDFLNFEWIDGKTKKVEPSNFGETTTPIEKLYWLEHAMKTCLANPNTGVGKGYEQLTIFIQKAIETCAESNSPTETMTAFVKSLSKAGKIRDGSVDMGAKFETFVKEKGEQFQAFLTQKLGKDCPTLAAMIKYSPQ